MQRRKCKLANIEHRDTDLRLYADLIIDAVNRTVPNKNPKVYADYFETDLLTQREAVLLGRELSKIPELCRLGKKVTTFRLFTGSVQKEKQSITPNNTKGGRVR